MNELYATCSAHVQTAGDACRSARSALDAAPFKEDGAKAEARLFSDELTKLLARLTSLQEKVRKTGLK